MRLISFYRIIKTSFVSLWRNRWLSLAATLIMVLTLITITFFISLQLVINATTQTLRSKVDMSVYFNDATSKDQIFAIQNLLLGRADIKSVNYTSKEKALEIWQERNKDNEKLRNIISETDNPLPRSLEIKTVNPEDLEKINDLLGTTDYKPLIKEISYKKNKSVIDRLVRITTFTKIVGWGLSTVFVLISILITYNTLRLTIFARREEIEIMKLVGASDWYVRGPFLLEGLVYGLSGALVAAIIFTFLFQMALPGAENYLGISNLGSQYLGMNIWFAVLIQMVLGGGLGIFCSVLAIRKHLV